MRMLHVGRAAGTYAKLRIATGFARAILPAPHARDLLARARPGDPFKRLSRRVHTGIDTPHSYAAFIRRIHTPSTFNVPTFRRPPLA